MANLDIPKSASALHKIPVSALRPITHSDGSTYRLTPRDWSRFVCKIRRQSNGCWLWVGSRSKAGYGGFTVNRNSMYAHRTMYMIFVGDIAKGMHTDHLCRNPPCCNPAHLEAVTPAENLRRSPIQITTINALKTECVRGHPLSGNNLQFDSLGRRKCKTCLKTNWSRVEHDPKRDSKPRSLKAECVHGHPLSGDNVRIDTRGNRQCRACVRQHSAKYYAKTVGREVKTRGGSPTAGHRWNGTTCHNGHELTDDNIYVSPSGQRRCRKCLSAYGARKYAEKKTVRPIVYTVQEVAEQVRPYVDALVAGGAPRNAGRRSLKKWADANGVSLPKNNDTLAKIAASLKFYYGHAAARPSTPNGA